MQKKIINLNNRTKAQGEKEVDFLSFALFIKVARNSLGLTQEEFGKMFGFTRANVCDIEKGRYVVSAAAAIKVARKAGLSEKAALQACLQDVILKAGSNAKVAVS